MGVVYKADQARTLCRSEVPPMPLPKILRRLAASSARARQRRRCHPNICTIHEIDEQDDQAFIVMEFLDGVTLKPSAYLAARNKTACEDWWDLRWDLRVAESATQH